MNYVILFALAIALGHGVQALDELLSRMGVISFLHGTGLGYLKILLCSLLFSRFDLQPGWLIVVVLVASSVAVSVLTFKRTGTHWVFALNAGNVLGMVLAGFRFV
jgi:hypothetical protein